MRQSAQRALHFGVIIILLSVFGAGCTLAGADPAPLTPVGAVPQEQPPTATPQIDPTVDPNLLPTPTEVVIDVFATQTAMALIPTPTVEPVEVTPEETIVPPTDEATEAPAEETQAPEVTEEATEEAATSSGTCKHTIASGENLYRIALKYEVTYQELAAANGIANPDAIRVGDELTIPGCESGSAATTAAPATGSDGDTLHTVQTGENLYRIAVKYGTTWTALASYNGIENPNALVIGQTIRIPASQ